MTTVDNSSNDKIFFVYNNFYLIATHNYLQQFTAPNIVVVIVIMNIASIQFVVSCHHSHYSL